MTKDIKRRDFISLLGGAAVWPLTARAQQQRQMPVIGVLHVGLQGDDDLWEAFRQGLRQTGFVEGQNVAIEFRFTQNNRAQQDAAELVRRGVTVIVTSPNAVAPAAAKATTTTIPIVFASGPDPVKMGLVASLNRPGGNLTGVTFLSIDLSPKRLSFLRDIVPQVKTVALLLGRRPNQDDPEAQLEMAKEASRNFGLQVIGVQAGDETEFEAAFATAMREGAQVLLVSTSIYFVDRRERLTALAAKYRLPTMYPNRAYVAAGGLMSYDPSRHDAYRQVGAYTGRVLKGEKPAELPVQLPTKFDLVINLKTANALGIKISDDLLSVADEIIE